MFKLANELKTAKDEEKKDMETELEKARQEEQTLKAKYEKLDRNSRKSGKCIHKELKHELVKGEYTGQDRNEREKLPFTALPLAPK